MSTRDEILARIRKNQPAPVAMPVLPAFAEAGVPAAKSWLEGFKAGLERMGATYVRAPADGDLTALVRRLFPDAAVVCSAAPEVAGNRPLADVR